ncbi:MAG: hypothetical protein J0I69_02835 [Altererythrobacter sp.]|nr:hypothetical protein [Altererythrobacter sp.]OJU60954.1 MAG: hypothetical protein BGO08_12575 [Altererythrobacter sp. 66-12]
MTTVWKILGFRGAAALVLAIALVALMLRADAISADRDTWHDAARQLATDVLNERAAHQATKETYRRAQAEAARLDAERLARVQSEQQEITDAITADYRARLADARAVAQRLRDQLARAGERAAGPGGGEPVPATGATAGGAAEAAGDNRLPICRTAPLLEDERTLSPLDLDWRLTATEQAIQLDALIDWVERQAAVSVEQPGR